MPKTPNAYYYLHEAPMSKDIDNQTGVEHWFPDTNAQTNAL